jgi:hypothetical protein
VAPQPEKRTVNSRNVKILAVVVLLLFGILFALNSGDRRESPVGDNILFPELKSRLNDINVVTITDADGAITLRREGDDDGSPTGGRWIAPDHGGYPVDTGSLRELLLAIADARKLEQKTSDPALYERLGVEDPREDGGDGVLVSARGDDAAISLILGDTAQREFRYARIPEQAPSWLIDQNPVIPDDSAGWLLPDIVNVDASRIRSAVIRHADAEVVAIRKEDADDVNFEVENIPEGRVLRYPSVANSIPGVLSNLVLEDVRADDIQGEELATAEFHTFDGLELLIGIRSRAVAGENADDEEAHSEDTEQQHWITVKAAATPAPAVDETQESPQSSDAPADGDDSAENAETDEAEAEAAEVPAEPLPDPESEAAGINQRVSGWAYRIPSYKAEQLTRRLEDLLSDPEDDATD